MRCLIPIRGHREDEEFSNKGNLPELLTLHVKDNDILKHINILIYRERKKHFVMLEVIILIFFSKNMADSVLKNIINDVLLVGVYSIIVDETQDLSKHQ